MKIPNAASAIIASDQLRDYLLNPQHRRGGSKAKLLLSFGYRRESYARLAEDLRRYHLSRDYDLLEETEYGRRYEIVGPIDAPDGRDLILRSIWQTDTGTEQPRLITIIPERKYDP